ncbi:MAG: T9SS type A sorting domain-containing protein [Ignavibacteriales bacterium]|nr:T9SS type A sorting domain-containing protein [Ignavibacteriales bacterium]
MNSKRFLTLSTMLLALFVVLSGTALAQVYVSATNGDDTFGTGSSAAPYRTIGKAITAAATGSTINVEAGTYNSTVLPGEGAPVTLAAAKTLTFVGTAVGGNTTVTITDGFTLNHASGVVDWGSTGTAKFNFGTSATALVLTAGSMTSANAANVVVGSGATLTFTGGTLNFVPTTGTNLNVVFNGTTTIGSTAAFLPSSYGSGTLTFNKASGNITVDNASISLTNLVSSGAASVTLAGSLTVAAGGDILNSSTGALTIGTTSSNTLTMTTSEATSTAVITVNAGGSVVVNSTVSYNVTNTKPGTGDGTVLTVGNIVALTGASSFTANGDIAFNNTNAPATTDAKNAVAHNLTISNGGSGALSIVGSISTPLSAAAFTTSGGYVNNGFVSVILSNTSTGSFAVRSAALRGATATNGVINTGGGAMTLGQSGDVFSTGYDVVNDAATGVMTVNATGTFTGTFTNNNAASQAIFGASSSFSKTVTNNGKMKISGNVLTLSFTGGVALANAGDIFSSTTATTGTGLLKFTGAAPTMTGTGNLPNVEFANGTSFATAGNTFYGNVTKSGAGTLTIGGASVIQGNLNMTGAGVVTINGATVVKGNVDMTAGSITLGTAGLQVEGTFNMPQGTFTFGANTLTLKGAFNRTGGTIDAAAAGTGTLNFAGATSQSFTPGTQMNVYNVTVNNTGAFLANVIEDDKVTVTASLIVLNNFTITTGRVILGTSNIRMQQAGGVSARFTNGGRGYTASGVGGIIFEGTGANTGAAADGAVITGTQAYSNIYIRLSTAANNVLVLGAVKISGVLTFDSGGLTWNQADEGGDLFTAGTLTLDDALVVPTVVINTANTHGSPFLVDGADGGAVALAITSVYNLSYTGATATTIGATDFVTTKVNDLSLIAGSAGKTITFIAGNGTIVGSLRVDIGETLQLTNGGARILTASGNTAAHIVNGTVTGGTFEVTGTSATLTGGSGTGNASLIADLLVDPATSGSFTSTGMKVLTLLTINRTGLVANITMNSATATVGTFVNTAGTTTLGMNSTASSVTGNFTVTAGAVTLTMNGAAALTRTIAGNLAVNGGTLTLGSHINLTGTATQTGSGSLALGDFNLTLADNYTHSGTGTITAGTGAVVAAAGATRTYTFTTTVDIPNLTLNSPGFGIQLVTSGLTVTGKFTHTAGDFDLNSLGLTLSGTSYTFTAGTYTNTGAATTGVITFTGTAMTIDGVGNPSIPYVTINTTGTITFNPDATTSPATARSLTASANLTSTKGTVELGINDIIVTGGVFNFTAGTFTATTSSSATANIGEIVFNGGGLTPATGSTLSIPNVRFEAATTANGTVGFTVANRLTFGKGNVTLGSTGRITLADGAVVVRVENTGTLSHAPALAGAVDVWYLNANLPADITSGVELPATVRNLTVNVAVGTGASNIVKLGAATTVSGTLSLAAGVLNLNSKTLTIADGATVSVVGGGSLSAALTPAAAYNLTYTGNAANVTTSNEWPSTATISTLTVSVGATGVNRTVNLHASRTVTNFTLNCVTSGSAIDLSNAGSAFTLTVTGLSTLTKGTVMTTTTGGTLAAQGDVNAAGGSFGATVQMSFTGAVDQTVTVPTAGGTVGSVTVNKTAGKVVLAGGNLTIGTGTAAAGAPAQLNLISGIIETGSNVLILSNQLNTAVEGWTRTVAAGGASHVAGNLRVPLKLGQIIAFGRNEFPVGGTSYRPVALTFVNSALAAGIALGVSGTVKYDGVRPTGIVGLPIANGVETGTDVARYPDFSWAISTTGSLGATQFNLELTAEGFANFDDIANVRIIRRNGTASDITNQWTLQGAQYDNFVISGTPSVVNVNSVGGLIQGGAIFTYGLKSTMVIANPIAPINLTDAAGTFTRNLTNPALFTGAQSSITYSVSVANSAIITASITNNVLTVTKKVSGSTSITVIGTDTFDGSRINHTVAVNVVSDVEPIELVPTEFTLSQNYPNPFNPSTTIKFGLPKEAPVTLEIYNVLGVKVRTLIAGETMSAAFHTLVWDGKNDGGIAVPSGVYLYRVHADQFQASKKMTLIK